MRETLSGIASILPKGEGFAPESFGAIALCMRDFTLHSRYRNDITVIGGATTHGFAGVNYSCIPPAKWYENRTRAYARGCAKVIAARNIRLAEIHNRPLLLSLIAGKTNCKLALHLHNDPQEMLCAKSPRERALLTGICDAIYCVSEYIRSRFLEGLNEEAAAKVHVVYNGIEIPETVPPKENIIAYAGRMTEGKGGLLLAHALRIALPQLPDWRAVLVGSRRHSVAEKLTPHEQEIFNTLQPLGISVEMPGFLPHEETLGFFARAAIAVVPSVWDEPFGRTAIEAMSQGCALISSGRGGLKEVTQDAAITLMELSPRVLAAEIIRLAQDKENRMRLQASARERAAYFSIAERTKVLDKVREEILARK